MTQDGELGHSGLAVLLSEPAATAFRGLFPGEDLRERMEQLTVFGHALYATNAHTNLTRIPPDEFAVKHALDSVLFHDLIPEGASVLDIGSGPGFPGWPLACLRPDLAVTILDSNRKATDFLSRVPLPNLQVVVARAEEWNQREQFDVVTGRALAPLPIQLELSAAYTRVGGFVIPMRTASEQEAVQEFQGKGLGLRLQRGVLRELPGSDAIRLFPLFEKVSPTESRFPRMWAEIKRKPLR